MHIQIHLEWRKTEYSLMEELQQTTFPVKNPLIRCSLKALAMMYSKMQEY
jgi:hypothetical protein